MLPVNQKIQFHVTSLDVVHSFWFYALGVKADAVPLNDNVVTATPTQIGTYRIQCSELCGLWHGNMSDDTAMVVSPSDFCCLDSARDDARCADHEIPVAVQPHVRTVANHLWIVMMFDTHSHTRES